MQPEKQLSENLAILEIFSEEQLTKHNLDYWWRKKYKQIFESNLKDRNELLINLNNAKENLDKIEYAAIKEIDYFLNPWKIRNKFINFSKSTIVLIAWYF